MRAKAIEHLIDFDNIISGSLFTSADVSTRLPKVRLRAEKYRSIIDKANENFQHQINKLSECQLIFPPNSIILVLARRVRRCGFDCRFVESVTADLNKGNNQLTLGIYVKKIVKGSIAGNDGRVCAGDQLLSCNRVSLIGITQERAAEIMANSGPSVRFEVARQAAVMNGLAFLLNQPSPPPAHKMVMTPADGCGQGPSVPRNETHRSNPAIKGQQRNMPQQPQHANCMLGPSQPHSSAAYAHDRQQAYEANQNQWTESQNVHNRSLSTSNLREDRAPLRGHGTLQQSQAYQQASSLPGINRAARNSSGSLLDECNSTVLPPSSYERSGSVP